ncbi:MAG: hypothetical protein V3V65_02685, partial [Hyphomicrobium sp.]
MKPYGNPPPPRREEEYDTVKHRWWLAEDDDLAEAVVGAAEACDNASTGRQQRQIDNYCMYGDDSVLTGNAYVVNRGRLEGNHIANAVDTVVSEVTQTKPRPMVVTIGGDWFDQQRARDMTHYGDAVFDSLDYYGKAIEAARDSTIAGIGILYPYIHPTYKEVRLRRILPFHLVYDDQGMTDQPREYFMRHICDKPELMAQYPDHADAIDRAPSPDSAAWWADASAYRDSVLVWEAIRLPSGPGKELKGGEMETDGRRCLVVNEAVLHDEPYDHEELPFAVVRAIKPVSGVAGGSLVERAEPLQTEHNELSERLQDAWYLCSSPIFLVPRAANVEKGHVVNDIGTLLEYDGPQPPAWYAPTPMSGDAYRWRERLKEEIYEAVGVSQLSATSLKPKGLDSGRALQVYNDVQSRRFINFERDFEGLAIDTYRAIVRLEVRLSEQNPEHEVVYENKQTRQRARIKWTEIDLEADKFRVRVFPSSAFPENPAAKIEMLQSMRDRDDIDSDTFYELLDVPDFESAAGRVSAPRQLILRQLDSMIRTGKYVAPDTYMDLELAIRETVISIQRATLDEAPEDRIQLLRDFLVDVQALIEEGKPDKAGPPMGPDMMPPGPMGPPGMMPPPGMEGMPPEMPPEMPPGMPPETYPGAPPDLPPP